MTGQVAKWGVTEKSGDVATCSQIQPRPTAGSIRLHSHERQNDPIHVRLGPDRRHVRE